MLSGFGVLNAEQGATPLRPVLIRPVPVSVQNGLANLRRAALAQEWAASIALAQELQAIAGDSLVPVGSDRLASTQLAIDLMLVDALQQQRLATIPIPIQGQYPGIVSPEGLLQRGEAAWEHGDLDHAQQLWRMLLPPSEPHQLSCPIQGDSSAAVYARLSLIEQLESRPQSAQYFLDRVRKLSPSQGRLAGRSGLWSELLQRELASDSGWPASEPAANPHLWDSTTSCDLQLLRRRWSFATSGRTGLRPVGRVGKGETWLSISPSIVRLLESNAAPSNAVERAAYLFSEDFPEGDATVPRAVIVDDDLYVCLGPQVLSVGEGDQRLHVEPVLVSLQISGNLRLNWKRTGEQIMEQPGWVITSSPVVANETLTVAMRSSTIEPHLGAAQLDRLTGEVLWRRDFGLLPVTMPRPQPGRDLLLTYASDTDEFPRKHPAADLLLLLPEGECLGLSSGSGRQLWSRGFVDASSALRSSSPSAVIDSGQVFLIPPQGRCICLSLVDGAAIWRETSSTAATEVIGICDDLVLLAGRSLRAVGRFDGQRAWSTAPLQRSDVPSGSAVLFGQQVLWSTADRLWLLDAQTGQPLKSWSHAILGTGAGRLQLTADKLLLHSQHGWDCFDSQIHVLAP